MPKKCNTCGMLKSLNEFSKSCKTKDNLRTQCKNCEKLYKRARIKTKEGLLAKIYDSQMSTSKRYLYKKPNYTLNEFRVWALGKEIFHTLYDNWVKSEFDKNFRPSFDRLDDYKRYSLNNLRITTFYGNLKRAHYDMKNGINNKQNKPIVQIDKNGKIINTFYSIRSASRQTGIEYSNIARVCCGERKFAANYKWEYINE